MASVQEIVKEYLEKNGLDGLYSEGECACEKDDLFPCCDGFPECQAGVKSPCDCGDHDFHIGPKE